ncbi:MAG: sulfonate ABC transporter substrate-binding protein, partial [Bradyrhizobium sp.]
MSTSRRQIITSGLGLLGTALLSPRVSIAAPGGDVPKEFKVGFQKGAAILVLGREQQVIEKRLKPLGVDAVQWVEFQFGPPMLEALGAGAIDIGSVGDTPPIFAQAAGSPLVYVASTPSAEHAVLVQHDSPIETL